MQVVLRVSRWHCHVSHGGAGGQEAGSEGADVADRAEIMCLPPRPQRGEIFSHLDYYSRLAEIRHIAPTQREICPPHLSSF